MDHIYYIIHVCLAANTAYIECPGAFLKYVFYVLGGSIKIPVYHTFMCTRSAKISLIKEASYVHGKLCP